MGYFILFSLCNLSFYFCAGVWEEGRFLWVIDYEFGIFFPKFFGANWVSFLLIALFSIIGLLEFIAAYGDLTQLGICFIDC